MLNISQRNSSFVRSESDIFFVKVKSTLLAPGPVSVVLPRFPKVPAGDNEKAHGTNHRLGVWSGPGVISPPPHPAVAPSVRLPWNPGFRFGRSGLLVSPVREL